MRIARGFGKVLLAGAGAAGLMAAADAAETVKGVTYRIRIQTQLPIGGGGGGDGGGDFGARSGGVAQLIRVDMAGDRAKVEFQVGNPPGSSLTDHYLMIIDSNKVYRVSPDSQAYADASLAAGGGRGRGGFGGGGGGAGGTEVRGGGRAGRGGGNAGGGDQGARGGRGMNPMSVITDAVVTSIKTTTEELGAGEAIEGRPTKKYRITADYEFKLYGQPRQSQTTLEVWAVDFAHRIVDPFEVSTVVGDTMSSAGIQRRLTLESRKIPGVHVKSITTQVIPISAVGVVEGEAAPAGAVGQTVNIVRTVTVTGLKEVDLDESLLAIPTGYRKIGFGRGGE